MRIAVGAGIGFSIGMSHGITYGIAVGIAVGIAWLRAYDHPLHLFFVWPKKQARWYCYHPVAWDDLCSLPFPWLDRLLVAYAEADAASGREIDRLIDEYPTQRMAALRARTTLVACRCGRCTSLLNLPALVNELPSRRGDFLFLLQSARIREMIGEIWRHQTRLESTTRPFLREPLAWFCMAQIETFQGTRCSVSGPVF